MNVISPVLLFAGAEPIPPAQEMIEKLLYTNNLKNREFDKNSEVEPTQSKNDSSSSLCIKKTTQQHPDLYWYKPEGKSGMHSIDAMRELIREASLPPYEAPVKIFVIEDADRMLAPAANALLKILEEPPEHCHIFLLSSKPEALLPTVTSRCHKLSFSREVSIQKTNPLLQEILTSIPPYPELLKKLTQLEETLALQEEEGIYFKEVETLFEQILYWVREHQPESLPLAFDRVEECRLAVQQNVKLRTALEWLFLNKPLS